MSKPGKLFAYLATLAVVQPARIQDIESYAGQVLGDYAAEYAAKGAMRSVHDQARKLGFTIAVRKGVYCLSATGAYRVRVEPLVWQMDNARLFLLKARRKQII